MGELEARIAKNNQTFRAANEQIKAKSEEYGDPLERIPFLCECALEDCREILRLTPVEYAEVRADPTHFFTVPGHAEADRPVGHVISRQDGYVVVEKDDDVLDT
jgi:hypothetical protein